MNDALRPALDRETLPIFVLHVAVDLIGDNSIVKLLGGGNVAFHSGAETLVLDNSKNVSGRSKGSLGVTRLTFWTSISPRQDSSRSYKSTLTVSDGAHTAKIGIVGTYQASDFSFASDGGHGVLIGLH
jgi:hypothetical protein